MSREFNLSNRKKEGSSKGFLDDIENLENHETSDSHETSESHEVNESSENRKSNEILVSHESRETNEPHEVREANKSSDAGGVIIQNTPNEDDNVNKPHLKKAGSRRKTKPYRTHGFMIDIEQYKSLLDYIDKRRMAGQTRYSQRDALREGFDLLFKSKKGNIK